MSFVTIIGKNSRAYAVAMVATAGESLASADMGIGFELIFTTGKIKNGIDLP